MDLRKCSKPAEEPASANSDNQLSSMESSSRSAKSPCGLYEPLAVPKLTLIGDKPGLKVPIPRSTADAPGEIWPNKQVWQYMTLPFTITLALQNLSPYGQTSKQLQLPSTPSDPSDTIDTNNSSMNQELEEMLNLSRRVTAGMALQSKEPTPSVVQPPPKRRYRRLKPTTSKQKPTNIDMIALSIQNKKIANANSSEVAVESFPPNSSQGFSITDREQLLKEKFYIKTANKPAPKRLPRKDNMKNGCRKRKAPDVPFSIAQNPSAVKATIPGNLPSTVTEQAGSYILLYTDPNAFKATDENRIQSNHVSCIQFAKPANVPSTVIKELEPPKLIATKGILLDGSKNTKQNKKVRFSEDVASTKDTEPNISGIPRMVFPIYNNIKSVKRSSPKENPRAVAKKMTANQQEIWTIREKVWSDEQESQKTLLKPILLQKVTGKMENTRPTSKINFNITNTQNTTLKNSEALASKKTISKPIENSMPSYKASTSNLHLPTPYQHQLLHCLPQERIKKAYNLHETLLEQIGGTRAMPERKQEIDAFRRDLIVELIRKQFDVENIDELRVSIMKYLAKQQTSKSCEEILDNVIKGRK